MGVTLDLIGLFTDAAFDDIPADAVDITKKAILDDVGIAFLGYDLEGGPVIEYARAVGEGAPEATLIGDGGKVSCLAAAGANAQMAQDTDFNETGPGHHIISPIAQTAISVAERTGSSGKDVIAAVAAAYQMSGHLHMSLLPHAVVGAKGLRHLPVSVAMTAGALMSLDEAQMNHAFGLAWFLEPQPTGGLYWHGWYRRRGMLHLATCQHGIQAALLAERGFQGPRDIIEQDSLYDLDRVMETPAPYWYLTDALQLKPWPSSRVDQQALQALGELIDEHGIDPTEIEQITFWGPELYMQHPFTNPEPADFWEAIYSLQWAIAMVALGYEPGREWFAAERFSDPACRDMARKVVVELDDEAEAETVEDVPSAVKLVVEDIANEIEVVAAGESFRKRKTISETLGSPTMQMSWDQVIAKFNAQAVPVIGEAPSAEIVERIRALEDEDEIAGITALFEKE